MATTSEVKAGLDDIAASIRNSRQAFLSAKARIQAARNELDAIPTTFNSVLLEIDSYTGADAFESIAAAEKQRLTTEFLALQSEMNALINSVEF